MLRKVEGLSSSEMNNYAQILAKLYAIYRKYDCKLVEINPLVVTPKGIIAADSRIDIDDDAVWRQPELGLEQFEEAGAREPTVLEIAAGQIDRNDHRGSAHFDRWCSVDHQLVSTRTRSMACCGYCNRNLPAVSHSWSDITFTRSASGNSRNQTG